MNPIEAISVLNDLLRILCRSLPAYLADAKPWTQGNDAKLSTALDHLVADQRHYAQRVAEAIVDLDGRPNPGRFSMSFSAKHDLAMEYVVPEVIEYQERDIARIEQCANQLADDAPLHALAEEILGNAKGHCDVLKEARHAIISISMGR
jgi:bacterioferritin (cytochrome b1)